MSAKEWKIKRQFMSLSKNSHISPRILHNTAIKYIKANTLILLKRAALAKSAIFGGEKIKSSVLTVITAQICVWLINYCLKIIKGKVQIFTK